LENILFKNKETKFVMMNGDGDGYVNGDDADDDNNI